MFKKIINSKKTRTFLGYGFLFLVAVAFIVYFVQITQIRDFIASMENRSFDLRQSFLADSHVKKTNDNIVLVTIDDASYEYLLGKYGEWPIPRDIYANFINYVEKQKPAAIAFDLMFIKSIKSKNNADMALVNAIKKYDNVYTSMNFDDISSDVRKPINLPKKFSVNLKNESGINFEDYTFPNCRAILPQILASTPNVGIINVSRSQDGILREIPPFLLYKNNIYPHLALLIGLKYLGYEDRNFVIDKNQNLHIANRLLPVDKDGGMILNWYGKSGKSFKQVPFYKVVKAMNGESSDKFDFKNKIVYVGTTAVSLYDPKSTPVDKNTPGVEVHATYVNNLIDNNFIKKVPIYVNVLTCALLAAFIGFVVIKSTSTLVALGTTFLTTLGYIIFSYYLMKFYNLWIAIILPLTVILLMLISSYIIKYLLKSRDFEYQYRLATTDGLTELYNHRYFQEQMIMQLEHSKRYDTSFSLILIDIDFFKKFNDMFGHQSGDAVLRQVAQKLKKNIRSTDVACRYGGEEMSIILPNTDKAEATITAQKICQLVAEKPFKLANDKESNVTISLGVATFPEDGDTTDKLIEASDKRLYKAKENGRNQVWSE